MKPLSLLAQVSTPKVKPPTLAPEKPKIHTSNQIKNNNQDYYSRFLQLSKPHKPNYSKPALLLSFDEDTLWNEPTKLTQRYIKDILKGSEPKVMDT